MRYSYKEIKSLDGLRLKRPPHQGEIAAAHLVIKQINQGKRPGEEITPFLRWVADYGSCLLYTSDAADDAPRV